MKAFFKKLFHRHKYNKNICLECSKTSKECSFRGDTPSAVILCSGKTPLIKNPNPKSTREV